MPRELSWHRQILSIVMGDNLPPARLRRAASLERRHSSVPQRLTMWHPASSRLARRLRYSQMK